MSFVDRHKILLFSLLFFNFLFFNLSFLKDRKNKLFFGEKLILFNEHQYNTDLNLLNHEI